MAPLTEDALISFTNDRNLEPHKSTEEIKGMEEGIKDEDAKQILHYEIQRAFLRSSLPRTPVRGV